MWTKTSTGTTEGTLVRGSSTCVPAAASAIWVEPASGSVILIEMEELAMPDQPDPDASGACRPDLPPPPAPERFTPGTLLAGRYRIVAPLGKGGMGEVYRADDLTLAQPVALKFLPSLFTDDPDRLARLRKE